MISASKEMESDGSSACCVGVRLLFDTGSEESFMRTKIADILQLRGPHLTKNIIGFNGVASEVEGRQVDFWLHPATDEAGAGPPKPILVSAFTVKTVCGTIRPQHVDPRKFFSIKPERFAQDYPHDQLTIDLLIGVREFYNIVSTSFVKSNEGPVAVGSKIGLLVSGQLKKYSDSLPVISMQSSLDTVLKQFWEVESLGIRDTEQTVTQDNIFVKESFQRTIRFCLTVERYFISLIFRPEITLKSNFDIALKRLNYTEKKFMRRPDKALAYKEQVQEVLQKDWAEEVDLDLATSKGLRESGTYYLPHSIVERPDAETTKNRLVFDGSCRNSSGVSLNDALFSGPKTQADLFLLLLSFRLHRIVLKADLSKMFHTFCLENNDRDYVRFLWRDSPDEPVKVYRWKRLPFGLNQSPFLAIAGVGHHLVHHAEEFPQASAALQRSLYVDDYVGGASTVSDAIELRREISTLMGLGGFHFAKWISNSQEVLSTIPEADRAAASALVFQEKDFELSEEPINKALGISWNPKTDHFSYYGYASITHEPGKETKRTLCSKMSRIFDPTGFLSPFTIRAKMLMQACWLAAIGWDDPLPEAIDQEWQQWLHELPQLSAFSPPRCLLPKGEILRMELHMFSDASEKAYATVAYLRFVETSVVATEGPIQCGLLAAKSRVAPLKKLSLPRLELLGILLSVRMALQIAKELGIEKSSVTFWSDNTTSVQWLRKSPNHWTTFVANRVAEIQSNFSPQQFMHLPGKTNISADIGSRGCSAGELSSLSEWLTATSFLYDPEELWPVNMSIGETELEKSTSVTVISTPDPFWIHLENVFVAFRDRPFGCLQRIAVWILRFLQAVKKNLPKKPKFPSLDATIEELRAADLIWCRLAQNSKLLTDINTVKGGEVPARLKKLSPFFDDKTQLLRVGGRLQYSDLPERCVHPIILPNNHFVVEMIVLHVHRSLAHAGLHQTHYFLRNRFWILHGKSEIRRILHKCNQCRRQKAKPYEQKMAPLPPERLRASLAFTVVGVDTAGPIKVKKDDGSVGDAHIAVWTCFSTRAVHLDVLRSLHTDSIVTSLKQLCYRRGVPQKVYSDNHKSFRKVDRQLRLLWKNIDQERVKREALNLPSPVEWHFIVERAPWMGGIWERMVRSVKVSLRSCLGRALVTRDDLVETIISIESQLNSRPLTSLSSDPSDLSPMTPAHLLHGRGLNQLPDYLTRDDIKDKVSVKWRHRQVLLSHFWNRWKKEYLLELQAAQKWHLPQKAPRIGEIVLIGEDNVPRSQWRLGRILECKAGRDGLVRSCLLRTPKGEVRRPLLRLYRMEDDVAEE